MAKNLNHDQSIERQPFLIYTPKREFLSIVAKHWFLLFLAVMFSFSIFWLISIPLYGILFFFISDFKKQWQSHRYSTLVLYLANGLMLLVFALLASPLRNGISNIFRRLLL